MRITAYTDELSMRVKTVTLNGADVTKVTKWADAEAGEVGLYPHRIGDGGVLLLLTLDEMADIESLLPLVTFGPKGMLPKIAMQEAPIITVCGHVEIEFKPEAETVRGRSLF